jgi:DNA-binding XRE family transcriptional regulator
MATEKRAQVAAIGWRPTMKFGDRLRAVRRSYQDSIGHRVGQVEMAQLIGVGRKAYASWESNLYEPSELWQVCLAVAAATGCDPVWLADIDPDGGPGGPTGQGVHASRCIHAPFVAGLSALESFELAA